jgi:hypothetical protein
MKQALIDPNILIETGYRVAEITDTVFDVAPPLFWQECPDSVVADQYYFAPNDSQFLLVPEPEQPIVEGAQTL